MPMSLKKRRWWFLLLAVCYAVFVAVHYPLDTDKPATMTILETTTQEFYDEAFQAPEQKETDYERIARQASEVMNVKQRVAQFVEKYQLQDKKVLEVGAGAGSLQDIVGDYTGLDISASARRHFRKPFVHASATHMPFAADHFDAIWSIWVLEHIPTPEMALSEMRRIVKDGGYIYLMPAWNCTWWGAQGYDVRPYADFGLRGKAIKASLPVLQSKLYRAFHTLPVGYLRWAAALTGGPTRLRYHRLTPNYDKYWQADSDAAVSIDSFETYLWFHSRGDACLSCPAEVSVPLVGYDAMVIRVRKPGQMMRAGIKH